MKILQTVTGVVVEGAKVGRTLGFPTINLEVSGWGAEGQGQRDRGTGTLAPLVSALRSCLPFGVYSGVARTPHGDFVAAIHYGPRHGAQEGPVLEAHLLDCDRNFYGETVTIDVYTKIRDVQKFEDTEALKKQIGQDVEWVRHNQPKL